MTPKIIFEDDSLMVIEKPAGLTVNRAETTKGEETLRDWVERKLEIGLAPRLGPRGHWKFRRILSDGRELFIG